jgi:Methylamine utilisation protein MauE
VAVTTAALPAQEISVHRRGRIETLGWLGGVVLGLVLAVAAALKALDPAAFAEEIARQGVTFGLPSSFVALAALGLELGLGAALIANLRRRSVLWASTALVLFFLFLTGRGAWRAAHGFVDEASCGCFGNLVERSPAQAFTQDLLLLALPLGVAWLGRPGARDGVAIRGGIALGLAVVVVLFALASPALPLDDAATRLSPGVALDTLCAGAGDARVCLPTVAPRLASGKNLVVLADIHADGFPKLAEQLNRAMRTGSEPPITVLAEFTIEEQQSMFWKLAPAFDLQATPRALLRPLYRSLPRSFESDEGVVTKTWSGLPPEISAHP